MAVFTLMLSTHAGDGVCFLLNSTAFAVYDAFCQSAQSGISQHRVWSCSVACKHCSAIFICIEGQTNLHKKVQHREVRPATVHLLSIQKTKTSHVL